MSELDLFLKNLSSVRIDELGALALKVRDNQLEVTWCRVVALKTWSARECWVHTDIAVLFFEKWKGGPDFPQVRGTEFSGRRG